MAEMKELYSSEHQNFEEGLLVPGGRVSAPFCPVLGVDTPCFCSQQCSEGSFLCWIEVGGTGGLLPPGDGHVPSKGQHRSGQSSQFTAVITEVLETACCCCAVPVMHL